NGIYGTNLNGLTLTGVTLDGNADQFSPDEAGLLLEEVTGVVNISNTTVKNSYEHNVKVINSSGTLTAFNVTGGTIGPNPAGTGAQGLLFQGTGAANMTLSVNGTTFAGNQSNGIFADTAGGAMDVTIQNSTFLDNNVGPGVSVSSSGNMTFNILNNTAYSTLQKQSIGINVFANASHTGTFVGTIAGNTIGQIGSLASGSIDGNGIGVKNEGGGTLTVLIDDNDVYEVGNGSFTGFEGIWVINSVTAGTVNATVTNNTVDQIRDDRGLQVRQTIAGTTCADIRGNTFTNIGGSTDLRVSQTAGTYNLVQTSQANLSTVNNGATTTVSGAINFGASANCPIPTSAPESPAGHPDATTTASNSSADQPRAAGRLSTSNLPIDQPSVPLLSAASPALAADQSTNLPIYQTPSGSRAPESGETVNVNIGTLPAGKSVTIVFDVIIDTPTTPQQIVSQVCNQGTVSATDLAPVLTDDPDVGGAADPTCTTMQPGSITIAKDQVPDGSTIFGFTGTIPGNTSFNVTGDTSLPINNVTPGSYTATENDPAPLFALTGLDCDDDASGVPSSGSTTTRTATINLEPGETITCTFTNTQQGVDLQVTKSDGGITAEPGDTIAYTLSYTNTGPIAASGVVLTETVPANTTFNPGASTAGWVCTPNGNAGSECTLAIGALAASGAGSATFAVDVDSPLPAQVTQIDNTVCIGDDGTNGADQNPNDNCGDDSTPVTSGSITIVKATNPAGGTGFNFTGDLGPFSLDDGGQQPFTGLPSGDYDVTEVVPTNWSLTSVVCTGGDSTPITDGVTVNLDPGENITCTFTNTEHVDLQVTKSDDGVTAEPGDTVAYTLSYTNTGGDATGVVLTETVPANTTFNPGASTAGWICTPNGNAGSECTLAIGALAASGNGSATFAVDVDSPLP
ncbi:MAG: DUF11 domain-containing protein, partial [Anaerolineae bacterium]|nr:DUF11 domain-containing protein [Anaerolineae bacterium]